MPPRTRIEPNSKDPLSEATPSRRLWAASLAKGYPSRMAFARAIGIRHNALSAFEADRAMLSLANFAKACQLVGYSMEEIYFGRNPRRREPNLSRDEIVLLCEELEATSHERAALKRFLDSPEGALQRMTRAYVVAFIDAHKTAREAGIDPELGLRKAISAGDTARATSDAIAAGVKPPPSSRIGQGRQSRPAQKRG